MVKAISWQILSQYTCPQSFCGYHKNNEVVPVLAQSHCKYVVDKSLVNDFPTFLCQCKLVEHCGGVAVTINNIYMNAYTGKTA